MVGGFRRVPEGKPWALLGHHGLVGRFEDGLFKPVLRPDTVLPVRQEHFAGQEPADKSACPAHNYEYGCHVVLL